MLQKSLPYPANPILATTYTVSHHCQCIEMKGYRPSVQEQQRSRSPGTEASLSGAASHTLHRRLVCPEGRQEEAPKCESTPLEGLHRVACRRGGKNATAAMVLHRLNLASSPTPADHAAPGRTAPRPSSWTSQANLPNKTPKRRILQCQIPQCPLYSAIVPLRFSRICNRPWKPQKTRKPWKQPTSAKFSQISDVPPYNNRQEFGLTQRTT